MPIIVGSDMYVAGYQVGLGVISGMCGSMLREKEISRGINIANTISRNNPISTESSSSFYIPQNRIISEWLNNIRGGVLVSRTLNIRYEGAVNIGDRNVITEEVFNPSQRLLDEIILEYNPIDFGEYMKERGYFVCDKENICICCCCGPCMSLFGAYIGYQSGYKEQFVNNLLEIKLEQFWKTKENHCLKKADVLVNERIDYTKEEHKDILNQFQSIQQQSFKPNQACYSSVSDRTYARHQGLVMI